MDEIEALGAMIHRQVMAERRAKSATCPNCEDTARRLREALSVLGKIAGTAEATKQLDGIAYLQNMAREAWLRLDDPRGPPSMAPTVKR